MSIVSREHWVTNTGGWIWRRIWEHVTGGEGHKVRAAGRRGRMDPGYDVTDIDNHRALTDTPSMLTLHPLPPLHLPLPTFPAFILVVFFLWSKSCSAGVHQCPSARAIFTRSSSMLPDPRFTKVFQSQRKMKRKRKRRGCDCLYPEREDKLPPLFTGRAERRGIKKHRERKKGDVTVRKDEEGGGSG